MRIRRAAQIVVGMLLGLLSACSIPSLPMTAEQTLRANLMKDKHQPLQQIQIEQVPSSQLGFTMAFRGVLPGTPEGAPPIQVFGYAVLGQQDGKWHVVMSRRSAIRALPPLVAYDHDQNVNDMDMTIFGMATASEVAFVSATFDNGRTLQAPVGAVGFVLAKSGSHVLRKLEVLDKAGQVLATYQQVTLIQPADAP